MNSIKINFDKIIFYEPRLEFSGSLRFLWRVLAALIYVGLSVLAFYCVFSNEPWLIWSGFILALFLFDRIFTVNKPPHLISELNHGLLDGINVADYLEPKTFRIVAGVYDKTLVSGGNFYLNLLKKLVNNKAIRGVLWRLEISPEEFSKKIEEESLSAENRKNVNPKELFEKVSELLKKAFAESYLNGSDAIKAGDLFAAVGASADESVKKVFYLFSINLEDLTKALVFSRFRFKESWRLPKVLAGFIYKPFHVRHRYMNRSWTARPTPILDSFGVDLTDMARAGQVGFLIGHEKEYAQMSDILSRANRLNAMLIGEPGSGKEAIVSRLARAIVNDKVPKPLFDKRIVSVEISKLVSGADPKEISQRVSAIVNETMAANNVILYIPDIHNLVRTSGENFLNAADIILPVLTSDVFQVIGATYPKEFKQSIEPRSDFMNAFEIIRTEELSEDDSIKLLTYESVILEKKYKTLISFEAIKQAVILAHKYFRQNLLPASAQNLLKEALALASQRGDKVLKSDHLIMVSERKINVPIHRATKDEAKKLLDLEKIIHESLIDQEEAVKSVANALREYRSGLSRSSGPIATFLFVGPTGVGKTELAKILAKTQFGSEISMVRFDMSEYQDTQSVYRFIGSPDGKISGGLTETIINHPYCLVLLDEFEKANKDVLNLFLQVFDDGRLTDNMGRVADFRNTIIIATSNANSEYIKEKLETGLQIPEFKDEFKKKLTSIFRPELLNRFSDVVVFKNLSEDDILKIAGLQLKKTASILEENQGVMLGFGDDAVAHIAKIGYDPVFGARPLRAAISNEIKSVLAEKLLKGEIAKGDKISAVMSDGKIKFIKK